jgi:hypothetical protein
MIKRKDQTVKDFDQQLKGHPTNNFHQFAGFAKIKEKEGLFLPREEIRKKYEESIGFFTDREKKAKDKRR